MKLLVVTPVDSEVRRIVPLVRAVLAMYTIITSEPPPLNTGALAP